MIVIFNRVTRILILGLLHSELDTLQLEPEAVVEYVGAHDAVGVQSILVVAGRNDDELKAKFAQAGIPASPGTVQ